MSSKKYRFQGTTFKIASGFSTDSPPPGITGITAADPAVVTDAAHGRATGDVVKISGVLGMTDINGLVSAIEVVDSSHFKLLDIDSSGYSAYTSGGTYSVASFATFCEVTNWNRQGDAASEIPASDACSKFKEFLVGLGGFGTTQVAHHFAPLTTIQAAVNAAFESGDEIATKVTLPNSGGILVQRGFVSQTSEQAGVDGKWDGSLSVRNTGKRHVFTPA